jgi:hypothetical protein
MCLLFRSKHVDKQLEAFPLIVGIGREQLRVWVRALDAIGGKHQREVDSLHVGDLQACME